MVPNVTDQTIALPHTGLPSASVIVAVRGCNESPAVKFEGVIERTVPFFVGTCASLKTLMANSPEANIKDKNRQIAKILFSSTLIFYSYLQFVFVVYYTKSWYILYQELEHAMVRQES